MLMTKNFVFKKFSHESFRHKILVKKFCNFSEKFRRRKISEKNNFVGEIEFFYQKFPRSGRKYNTYPNF